MTVVTIRLDLNRLRSLRLPARLVTEAVRRQNYCWIVLCKNHSFRMRQSFLVRHRIPLAETDAVTPLPRLPKHFTVQCDDCRKRHAYKPKDVLRSELELPESFKPHPLFQEEPEAVDSDRSKEQEQKPRQEEPPQGEQLQGEARKGEPSHKKEPPQEGQTRAEGA